MDKLQTDAQAKLPWNISKTLKAPLDALEKITGWKNVARTRSL